MTAKKKRKKKPAPEPAEALESALDRKQALRLEGRRALCDEILHAADVRLCGPREITKAEAFMRGALLNCPDDARDDFENVLRLLREQRAHLSALQSKPDYDMLFAVGSAWYDIHEDATTNIKEPKQ